MSMESAVRVARGLLTGGVEEASRGISESDGPEEQRAFSALVVAIQQEAVLRRFPSGPTQSEAIAYVGLIRAHYLEDRTELDAKLAERMVLAAFGKGEGLDGVSDQAKVDVQGVLLGCVVQDLQLDDDGIDRLLAKAQERATRWINEGRVPETTLDD